jgi:BBSome-interacting protein 1
MDQLTEVLPKTGAVLVEKGPLTEVLCKPKILPLKSVALEKAEKIAKEAEEALAARGSRAR